MILSILLAFVLLFVLQQTAIALYNLYLHPLARAGFKGPRLYIAFPILRYVAQCRGIFDQQMVKFHQKYGPVVRYQHDELSFTTAQAWKDIYSHPPGRAWPKQEIRPPGAVPNIVLSDEADHARFRHALAPAFSDRSLTQQESLIKSYVDLLINGLSEEAQAGREVDMTMWYNLATFDISTFSASRISRIMFRRLISKYSIRSSLWGTFSLS